jgi:hypothetical protein
MDKKVEEYFLPQKRGRKNKKVLFATVIQV